MRKIETEVIIDAAPKKVWGVFGQFEEVGKWQSWLKISEPKSVAEAQEGKALSVTLTPAGGSPFSIKPQVTCNKPHEGFAWRGKLWGSDWFFVGEHGFHLEPVNGGKQTRFVHKEQFQGLLIPLLGGVLNQAEEEFNKFNTALKKKVEGK